MIKTAYRLGMLKAFNEENVEQLLKEAQALGIDVEKLGFGLADLGRFAGKGLGFASAHPLASRMAGGAALGGAAAGLTGGNVGKGMAMGGVGGAALHGLGGKAGMSKWMMGGAPGSGRANFMGGLRGLG